MNLTENKPILLAALAVGAMWYFSARRASPNVAPAPVGATAVNGGGLMSLATSVLSLFRGAGSGSMSQDEMTRREAGRDAVRAGDPYYGGEEAASGTVPGWGTGDAYGNQDYGAYL
jgi:hypothetical protein